MADINHPVQGANTGTWGTDLNNWLKENVFTATGWLKDPVYVSQYITHKDDADTYLDFTTDALSLVVGGVTMLTVTEDDSQDKICFSPAGGNVRVGIGTTAPASLLHVVGDAASCQVLGDTYGSAISTIFAGRRALGTAATPLAVTAGAYLGSLSGAGYHTAGTPGFSSGVGMISIISAEAFTDVAQGAYMAFYTTPIGATAYVERMRILDNGRVGIGTTAPGNELEVVGTIQCDTFRLDQAASSGSLTCDKYVTMNFNGVSYKVPCVAA